MPTSVSTTGSDNVTRKDNQIGQQAVTGKINHSPSTTSESHYARVLNREADKAVSSRTPSNGSTTGSDHFLKKENSLVKGNGTIAKSKANPFSR